MWLFRTPFMLGYICGLVLTLFFSPLQNQAQCFGVNFISSNKSPQIFFGPKFSMVGFSRWSRHPPPTRNYFETSFSGFLNCNNGDGDDGCFVHIKSQFVQVALVDPGLWKQFINICKGLLIIRDLISFHHFLKCWVCLHNYIYGLLYIFFFLS